MCTVVSTGPRQQTTLLSLTMLLLAEIMAGPVSITIAPKAGPADQQGTGFREWIYSQRYGQHLLRHRESDQRDGR